MNHLPLLVKAHILSFLHDEHSIFYYLLCTKFPARKYLRMMIGADDNLILTPFHCYFARNHSNISMVIGEIAAQGKLYLLKYVSPTPQAIFGYGCFMPEYPIEKTPLWQKGYSYSHKTSEGLKELTQYLAQLKLGNVKLINSLLKIVKPLILTLTNSDISAYDIDDDVLLLSYLFGSTKLNFLNKFSVFDRSPEEIKEGYMYGDFNSEQLFILLTIKNRVDFMTVYDHEFPYELLQYSWAKLVNKGNIEEVLNDREIRLKKILTGEIPNSPTIWEYALIVAIYPIKKLEELADINPPVITFLVNYLRPEFIGSLLKLVNPDFRWLILKPRDGGFLSRFVL